jgi:hypothetical protein
VKADPKYKTWKNVSAQAVHVEVTDMKHQPEGLHDKRKVTPSQACYACEEILDLLEMAQPAPPESPPAKTSRHGQR